MANVAPESIAQAEESYYRAIRDAKLSDMNVPVEILLPYSKDAFQNWVKQVDIYDLDKRKADFYVDERIVTTFTYYRKLLQQNFPNRLNMGETSSVDNSRTLDHAKMGAKWAK